MTNDVGQMASVDVRVPVISAAGPTACFTVTPEQLSPGIDSITFAITADLTGTSTCEVLQGFSRTLRAGR